MHLESVAHSDEVDAQVEGADEEHPEVCHKQDFQKERAATNHYNSDNNHILTMQARKEKTIDKYVLGEQGTDLPNGITVLSAKHMISGEEFTVKRIPITSTANSSLCSVSKPKADSILYQEIKKIKDLNIPHILKCLQVIKTKRSLYLVYEHYPEHTLISYLEEKNPTMQTKLSFAKKICEILQEVHRKGYFYVSLCPQSILVDEEKKGLKFIGLESAISYKIEQTVHKQMSVSLEFARNLDYCAPEVIESGKASILSDIYSAGKLFELLGVFFTTGDRPSSKLITQTLMSMKDENPSVRPNLNKVWSCLKVKEDEIGTITHNSPSKLKLANFRKNRIQSIPANLSPEKAMSNHGHGNNLKVPVEKRNMEDEKKCRQILKIRTLVLYLTDLANFCLENKDKELFYLLLKKAAIIRSNLVHQAKKVISITPVDEKKKNKIQCIKQLLVKEQTDSLNFLSKVEEILSAENHPHLEPELEKRNELSESLLQKRIKQFLMKHKKEVKPFHSASDEKERSKLINLCGLSEKLVYGSFETFFDEVVDEDIIDLNKQKYFGYLKTASTRELTDRLDRILRDKN